ALFRSQDREDKPVENTPNTHQPRGGPHTFNVVWAPTKFYNENRRAVEAFIAALDDAMKQIAADPDGAAALWVKAENSKLGADYLAGLIRLPENEWTMVPKKIMAYAEFMNRVGVLQVKPSSWKDVFFPDTHGLPGS